MKVPEWSEVLNLPLVKQLMEKLAELSANKQSLDRSTEIFNSINFEELLLVQLGVIIFLIILRSFIFSKVKSFWAHLFVELWTIAIAISLMCFFIPLYVIGFEYIEGVKILFNLINK